MDVLVIGGSVFLGRAVVSEAQALGADVTVFNRGQSGPTPDGATQLVGDRTNPADLEQLRGRRFDLVVDTCGFVPADVALSANLLADSCGHYAFVSSINAFPGWPEEPDYLARGAHDGNPDATRDDVPEGMEFAQSYGWLKVGCELAVQRAFGAERSSALRGGAIVGPHDGKVGRLPWWIDRVARGGKVLVPGSPDAYVALIDARDLARFALSGVTGTFETPGPTHRDTRADLMAACAAATGSHADPRLRRGRGVAGRAGRRGVDRAAAVGRAGRRAERVRASQRGRRSGRAELASARGDRGRHLGLAAERARRVAEARPDRHGPGS